MSPKIRKKKIILSKLINFQRNCYVNNRKKDWFNLQVKQTINMRLDESNYSISMTVDNTFSLKYPFIVNHDLYIGI